MTLTIETTVQEKKQLEIEIPCFFRNIEETKWLGVLDKDTVVEIYDGKDLKTIKNFSMWLGNDDVAAAYEFYHSCTETEFLEKYDEVIASISLHPKLAV